MTALVAPGPAPSDLDVTSGAELRSRLGPIVTTPVVAWLLLAGILFGLTLVNDPGGYLGTDTGGKVLTLDHMASRGTLDPDIGYWAERWDPEGRLHPIALTAHIGDRWVNVTTLPALLVAEPLYAAGGYRATLAIPILGTVLCAAAARAIARRCGARTGWSAYWLVGLASPLTIYALDFWEHSLGVGLASWGVVLLVDVAGGLRGPSGALAAGVLVGAGASMRTDVLAYGAVATLVALSGVARRERTAGTAAALGRVVVTGAATAAGLVSMVVANAGLEQLVLDGGFRADRAASAASAGGSFGLRVEEGLITTFGLNALDGAADRVAGILVLTALAHAAVVGARDPGRRTGAGLALVLVAYVGIAVESLGFVPGLFTTTPVAVIGAVLGPRLGVPARRFLVVALGTLPLVFATQWVGGAVPQWGGRYILTSAVLLAAVGAASFDRTTVAVRRTAVAASVIVTCTGVAWLAVRSHDVADSFEALRARDEPVLVSADFFVLREGGAAAVGERWLTAPTPDDRLVAAQVVEDAGYDRFALVSVHHDGSPAPEAIGDFVPTGVDAVPFIGGNRFDVVTYAAVGPLMRSVARLLVVLLTPVTVFGLSKAHALHAGYDFSASSRLAWAIGYTVALVVAAYACGLPDLVRSRRAAYGGAVVATVAGAGSLSVVQLALGDALLPRSVVFGSAAILAPTYAILGRACRDGATRAAGRDRVVVVADLAEAELLRDDLDRRPEHPAQVVGVLSVAEAMTLLRGDRPVADLVAASGATVIALSRAAQDDESIVAQVAELHLTGVRVRTLSLFYEEWLGKLPVTELERVSLMFDIGEIHRARYGRAARVIDTVLAGAGALVLALVLPLVLAGNALGNRGPLLFRQERIGKGGRRFEMLKLRTMRPHATGGGAGEWTTASDPRITAFGRLLRRSHLDELPQVLNILRGDLAVVGPRPEQPHYVDALREKLPFYDLRHIVRPGLTGWAQVKYPYGADEADALEKLQYEFFYLRRQSIGLDLRIVGRTVRSVLRSEGR